MAERTLGRRVVSRYSLVSCWIGELFDSPWIYLLLIDFILLIAHIGVECVELKTCMFNVICCLRAAFGFQILAVSCEIFFW